MIKEHLNTIEVVKTYQGTEVSSDHNPLIANVTLKLKCIRKKQRVPRLEVRKLNEPNIKENVKETIYANLDRLGNKTNDIKK